MNAWINGPSINNAIYAGLNVGEAFLAAMVARRVCGAALDVRRPKRLWRFALLAAAPAVVAAAVIGLSLLPPAPGRLSLYFTSWVSVELLGMLVVTPCMLMLDRAPRRETPSKVGHLESSLLVAVVSLATLAICLQLLPIPISMILPLVMFLALRLSVAYTAVAILLVAVASFLGFVNNNEIFNAFDFGLLIQRDAAVAPISFKVPSFYLFITSILLIAYPVSTTVSERRRLEARLRALAATARRATSEVAAALAKAKDSNQTKGRFLSMMSHELRTPLNTISGYAQLLGRDADMKPDARKQIDEIARASDHLLVIVEDMLEVARGDIQVEDAPFAPAESITAVVESYDRIARAKGLEIRLEGSLTPDDRFVGDDKRIRQILGLLMSNAVKFTTAGVITVTMDNTRDGCRFSVSDTGCGMDPTNLPDRPAVFTQTDSSRTRAHEGTGVGLALAGRILTAVGGSWSFRSAIGEGLSVTVDLPMTRISRAVSATGDTASAPRILIVDDHPVNREMLALMVETLGFATETARDGVEAVATAERDHFDLILMDLRMPRMDGFEATRAIRDLDRAVATVPILAVSAESRADNIDMCESVGIDAFLTKPVTELLLFETITHWLGERANRPSPPA